MWVRFYRVMTEVPSSALHGLCNRHLALFPGFAVAPVFPGKDWKPPVAGGVHCTMLFCFWGAYCRTVAPEVCGMRHYGEAFYRPYLVILYQ